LQALTTLAYKLLSLNSAVPVILVLLLAVSAPSSADSLEQWLLDPSSPDVPAPVIRSVTFHGNTVISDNQLASTFATQIGKPINRDQFSCALDRIEEQYRRRGTFALVKHVQMSAQTNLDVFIAEPRIAAIQIFGSERFIQSLAADGLGIKPGTVYNERELLAALKALYDKHLFLRDITKSFVRNADPDSDTYTLTIEAIDGNRDNFQTGIDTSYFLSF
jgi:outer membrane protein assembly factor BamA